MTNREKSLLYDSSQTYESWNEKNHVDRQKDELLVITSNAGISR